MSEAHPTPDRPVGQPDWDAIARHVAGEGTAEESAAVGAWLSAHPDDARAVQVLAEASNRLRHAASAPVDVEAALSRVHRRMRASSSSVIPLRPAVRSARRPVVPWIAAAAAVLVVTAGLLRARHDPTAGAAQVLATNTGQLDSLRLADGTRVVLGPSSELRVRATYATGRREVQLRGTAFFEVHHDAARPFSVRAERALITDVGTAFTVRSDGAEGVEVSVREGSVRVQHDDGADEAVLAAGDAATLQQSGTLSVRRGGAKAEDDAWTRGRLVFRETPLARVRTDLRRWYGLELVVTDSTLASRHLTASFTNDSRRQVLDVIALALGASYDLRGDTVTLRPAPLTVRPRP